MPIPPSEIPPFTVSGLLPPYLADATDPAAMSPYRTSLVQLVERYGSTPRRLQILFGLLAYRRELAAIGFTAGFQWLDGSFLEDLERTDKRPPGDIDLITFFRRPSLLGFDHAAMQRLVASNTRLFDSSQTKIGFSCDAYFVDLDLGEPEYIVDQTRYWFGLFSHKRVTQVWKGLLEIPLGDPQDATDALALVEIKAAA